MIEEIIDSFLYNVFFINPSVKWTSISFPFDIHLRVPSISSPFKSLITSVHGSVFLILLMIKTSSDKFEVYPLAKMFFYLVVLTRSATLNLGSFSLESSLYAA